MTVAVGRLVLDFFNNTDLPAKRRQLAELCAELRKKFNLSALEVADFEDLERCVIGFAAALPDHWKDQRSRDFLEDVCRTIDATSFARVTVEDTDLLTY